MGRVENPLNGKPAVTVGTPSFHSHPSGTRKKGGEKIGWQQPPSQYDIQNYPKNKNGFVFGMESGIIYKYNRTGVISILPISVIK